MYLLNAFIENRLPDQPENPGDRVIYLVIQTDQVLIWPCIDAFNTKIGLSSGAVTVFSSLRDELPEFRRRILENDLC